MPKGVQKYPVLKTRSEKPDFRFLKPGKLPGFPNSGRVPGFKPGIRVGYGSRILENRVPGIRFDFFFLIFISKRTKP